MATSPITWQSLSNHNLPDPTRLMALGQESMNAGMAGFQKMTDNYLQGQQNIADKAKVDNLAAFKQSIFGMDANALQAAIADGTINNRVTGYDKAIDPMQALSYAEDRISNLQRNSVANQQYQDTQTDLAQRPVVAGYQGALAQAQTPEGVRALQESMQAAVGAGVMDPRVFAKTMQEARGINTALTNESRTATEFGWKGAQEKDRAALAPLERAAKEAAAKASLASAEREKVSANNAGITARTNYLDKAGELVKQQTAAINEVIKGTPYAVRYNENTMQDVHKLATERNDKDPAYGDAVISKLADLSKEFKKDIPVEVVQSAISMAKNDTFDFLKGSNGYARSVADHIRNQMKSPEVIGKIAYADEQVAKARGQYNGSTLETVQPTVTNAAGLPAPTPAVQELPSQLKFNPPKVSATGSLVYDKPGSFNISSNKGIMTPAKLPTGSLEATIKDGDTVGVKGANGVSLDFRFNGLDAQETGKTKNGKTIQGQRFSEEAKTFITEAFKTGRVDIKVASNKPDSYGRLVADIYVDGKNLNEALLRKGLASVMSVNGGIGPSQKAAFEAAQREAMANNTGIMGDLNSNRSPTGAAYRMFGDNLYE